MLDNACDRRLVVNQGQLPVIDSLAYPLYAQFDVRQYLMVTKAENYISGIGKVSVLSKVSPSVLGSIMPVQAIALHHDND